MRVTRHFRTNFVLLFTLLLGLLAASSAVAAPERLVETDTSPGEISALVATPIQVAPGVESALATPAAVTNIISNGSFEDTPDFNTNGPGRWINATFSPHGGGWRVQTSNLSNVFTPLPAPTDGQKAALLDNSSDGLQPDGSYALFQDFLLPSGVSELSFDLAWQASSFGHKWTPQSSLSFDVPNNKQISVDLLNPEEEFGAPSINILANLFRTQASTPLDSGGYKRFRSTITNSGPARTIRLRFVGVNNLINWWQIEVDRVILTQADTVPTQFDVDINQIDTTNCPEVKIITSVRDQLGNPVTGLTKTNFVLKEDTQVRTITSVTWVGGGTVSPLSLAILIDRSGSLSATDLAREKQAAKALVSQLQPIDQVSVYSFGSNVMLLQDFTSNRNAINAAIDSIPSGGSTTLYDAVVIAAQRLGSVSGRKALVLMTDGTDTDSTSTLAQAIAASKAAGTPVFPIGFGNADANVLTQLANQTGGFFSSSATSSDLQQILDAIGQVLSSQYEITFTTTSVTTSHTIEITVTSDGISGKGTSSFEPCGTTTHGVNVNINQIDITECPTVRVITSVRDSSGAPITGLTSTDFTLREDRIVKSISVRTVEVGGSALSLAILIDRSGSLSDMNLADEKSAAKALVSQLRSIDQVAIYSFGSTVSLLRDFTTDRTAINSAIDGITRGGETSLYDAIVAGSRSLATRVGRKAIVLMTDGEDTISSATLTQAVSAAKGAGTPVFTIGFGNSDANILTHLANQTGGFFSVSANSADLQQILNAIGQVLSNQYEITFTTTNVTQTHSIEVGVTHGGSSGTDTASLQPCGEGTGDINVNINQVDVSECPTTRVITSVRDSSGVTITGLTKTNFTLREDGIIKTISVGTASSSGGSTLSLAILIDRSGSLSDVNLADEKAAAKALVAQLDPLDAVAIYSFGSTVTLRQDYTTNRPAINNAIDGITRGGETSLYDAIVNGAKSLEFQTERKALVLMTDGEDTASSKSLSDAIAAANSVGVPVFPIGFGNANANVLAQLANQTGGFFSSSAGSSDLQRILSAIGKVLTSQYEIVFTSTSTSTTRIIEIAVTRQTKTGTATTTLVPCESSETCSAALINLQDTTTGPSTSFDIPVILSGSCQPVSFQFDITYDDALLSFNNATKDTVLTQAGKDVSTNGLTSNSTRVIAAGLNQTPISDGPALKLNFTSSEGLDQDTKVSCSNVEAVDAQARSIPITCSEATVRTGCSCDVNGDGKENVADVQLMTNQAIGKTTATCDLNTDGKVSVADVQIVTNAALGRGCNVLP